MEKIETSKINLVDLRLYWKEEGVLVDNIMPKALVVYDKSDNKYHNIIVPEETYPLIKRLPYSNTTSYGLEYGTKLIAEDPSQINESCICGIDLFIEDLKKQPYIEMEELEDKMLYSNLYFKDRIRIIEKRINNSIKVPKKLRKKVSADWEKNCNYQDQIFLIRDEIKKLRKK